MAKGWTPPPAALLPLLLLGGFSWVTAQIYKCHQQCKTCHLFDYDQSWHCVECNDGYELWVDGCFLPCALGEYRYGYNCKPCTDHCNHCVGGMRHECTECASNYEFDMRSVCVRSCDAGYYPLLDSSGCGECNAYCKTCLSEYRISCTSCFDGYYLRILDENTSSGECMLDCNTGFFRDATNDLRCIQCSEYCLACDSLENCSSCEDGTSLYRGLCYVVPDYDTESTIDFMTYMNSGAGLTVDLDDGPPWINGRRLRSKDDGMCMEKGK